MQPVATMQEIAVQTEPEPYSIVIEPGILSKLGELVRGAATNGTTSPRCLLAVDSNLSSTHGLIARKALEHAGYEVAQAGVLARETSKTLSTVHMLYSAMLEAHMERGSTMIALGGGTVGDTAGFAAATFLRGVPLVQVPTTLLAMVDASIGGKTGVNFPLPSRENGPPSGLGKNLIGAFWQPRLVVADPLTLRTLPQREFVCGLAECVKHAMIADAALLRWIEENARAILLLKMETLSELIVRSASIKAGIVAEDVRERGRRALLNLGHTFAHAIESAYELNVRHGEAVAIGLRAAMHVAMMMERLSRHEQDHVLEVFSRLGLPSALPAAVDIDHLMHAMSFDKKVSDHRRRLVLPRGIGAADVADDVPAELVRQAWLEVGASA